MDFSEAGHSLGERIRRACMVDQIFTNVEHRSSERSGEMTEQTGGVLLVDTELGHQHASSEKSVFVLTGNASQVLGAF